MLDEAIYLIQKEIYMYKVMYNNVRHFYMDRNKKKVIRERIKKEIRIREFILKSLNEKM